MKISVMLKSQWSNKIDMKHINEFNPAKKSKHITR